MLSSVSSSCTFKSAAVQQPDFAILAGHDHDLPAMAIAEPSDSLAGQVRDGLLVILPVRAALEEIDVIAAGDDDPRPLRIGGGGQRLG